MTALEKLCFRITNGETGREAKEMQVAFARMAELIAAHPEQVVGSDARHDSTFFERVVLPHEKTLRRCGVIVDRDPEFWATCFRIHPGSLFHKISYIDGFILRALEHPAAGDIIEAVQRRAESIAVDMRLNETESHGG